jgi:hypothetical protein
MKKQDKGRPLSFRAGGLFFWRLHDAHVIDPLEALDHAMDAMDEAAAGQRSAFRNSSGPMPA